MYTKALTVSLTPCPYPLAVGQALPKPHFLSRSQNQNSPVNLTVSLFLCIRISMVRIFWQFFIFMFFVGAAVSPYFAYASSTILIPTEQTADSSDEDTESDSFKSVASEGDLFFNSTTSSIKIAMISAQRNLIIFENSPSCSQFYSTLERPPKV